MVESLRDGEAGMRRHGNPLAQAAAVWKIPTKVKAPTKVRVALLAKFAPTAWLGGVDCDARARNERLILAVKGFRSGLGDNG
jgi:hypothetical protein